MKQIKQTIFLCLLWMIGIGVHAEEIPNNEIWYTSSNGKVVKPNVSYAFDASIISNTYSDGKGVIKFDNSVTRIGGWAFYYCSGLTSINIPNSVRSIGERAFYYCSGLTSITIPNSVTSIGDEAFYYCSGLTSIDIPNSVTSIGEGAFCRTKNVTTITVDKMNQFYDSRDNCKAIIETRTNTLIAGCKNTITPNSVTSIGNYAFGDCSGLTSITIPNSVTSIGDWAFEGCTGLTSIEIPSGVTSIGYEAFYECSGLISIKVSWSRPLSISTNVFRFFDKTKCVLYVPKGTSTLYKSAPVWEDFQNIQEYDVTDIKSTPSNSDIKVYASSNTITISGVSANEPVSVYDTNGVRVAFGTGNGNIQVNGNGVYFVKTEGQTFKVCM